VSFSDDLSWFIRFFERENASEKLVEGFSKLTLSNRENPEVKSRDFLLSPRVRDSQRMIVLFFILMANSASSFSKESLKFSSRDMMALPSREPKRCLELNFFRLSFGSPVLTCNFNEIDLLLLGSGVLDLVLSLKMRSLDHQAA
jgi:hypothetical protein